MERQTNYSLLERYSDGMKDCTSAKFLPGGLGINRFPEASTDLTFRVCLESLAAGVHLKLQPNNLTKKLEKLVPFKPSHSNKSGKSKKLRGCIFIIIIRRKNNKFRRKNG